MAGRGDILAWEAENIQISLFSNAPHQFSATTLFVAAFDEEPSASNENNHPQLGRLGSASSPAAGRMLRTLQLQPGRCDIILHPSGDDLLQNKYPAKIRDVPEQLDLLVGAMLRLVGKVSQVSRIAINCRFAQHFETLEDANSVVSKVLPVAMDLDKGRRDFILQYNIRASVNGHPLNRLMKWAVEPVQVFGGIDPTQQAVIREFWAAVVHLDFNTVVPRPIFKDEEVGVALQSLRESFLKARKDNLRLD